VYQAATGIENVMSDLLVIKLQKVKRLLVPFILSVPLIMTAAAATTTLAAKVEKSGDQRTCADFLSVEEQLKPKVVYWAAAYAKGGQPEAAVIDIKGIEEVTLQIIGE
jgi:acid stress chaperone HdeA